MGTNWGFSPIFASPIALRAPPAASRPLDSRPHPRGIGRFLGAGAPARGPHPPMVSCCCALSRARSEASSALPTAPAPGTGMVLNRLSRWR